jgi:hypothetical protein
MATAERTIIYEDPTAGLSLVSTRDPNLELTRYLFTAGQFLDPDRVGQLDYMREAGGGEEIQAHCLRRSKGGFIARARLTPLEVWADPMPPELIGEGAERETVVITDTSGAAPASSVPRRPGQLIGRALRHVKYYPGDEIKSIRSANEGKGIVEVTALMGAAWWKDEERAVREFRTPREPGIAQILNRDFFPTLPPPVLKELREVVDKAAGRSEIHGRVASDMLASCAQFERWAQTRLAVEHGLLLERKSHQYVHTYSPIARELLRQLDMKPQDIIHTQSGVSDERMAEIVAKFGGAQNMTPEFIAQIVGQVTSTILAAQAEQPKNKGGRPPKAETKPEGE